MTATITRTAPSTTNPESSVCTPSLWRKGVRAGLMAAAATVGIAAAAQAAGISFETEPGKAIPLLGFAQLTLVCTAVGVLIARTIRRRAGQPRSTFTRTTVALTGLSCVPDIALSVAAAAKITLVLTHLVAAAIVIPAIAACLPERGAR